MDTYNTNTVGSMLTIQSFHPLLTATNTTRSPSARLMVVISSQLGSIEASGRSMGSMAASYRASKAALNMLGMTYAEEEGLRAKGGKVLCMHPGERDRTPVLRSLLTGSRIPAKKKFMNI